MFDDNNSDDEAEDSTENTDDFSVTRYIVRRDDTIVDIFDDKDEANDVARDVAQENPWATVTTRQQDPRDVDELTVEYEVRDRVDDHWNTYDNYPEAAERVEELDDLHTGWSPFGVNVVVTVDMTDDELLTEEDVDDELGSVMADIEAEFDIEEAYPEAESEDAPQRYGFFETDEPEEPAVEQTPYEVEKWSLGSHSTAEEGTGDLLNEVSETLDDEVDADAKAVLEEAAKMVTGTGVHDFECGVCGLNHGHSDTKHDIRPSFSVTDEFADQMEFSPFCHCGVNELAMLIDYYGYINAPMFADADEKFSSVREMGPEALDLLVTTYSQAKHEERVRDPVEYSLTEANLSTENVEEVRVFLRRLDQIKSAASGAPIAAETRNDIDDLREEVEERVQR